MRSAHDYIHVHLLGGFGSGLLRATDQFLIVYLLARPAILHSLLVPVLTVLRALSGISARNRKMRPECKHYIYMYIHIYIYILNIYLYNTHLRTYVLARANKHGNFANG